jgi:hypothetical protein
MLKHKKEIRILRGLQAFLALGVSAELVGQMLIKSRVGVLANLLVILPGLYFVERFIGKYIRELQDDEETHLEDHDEM